MQKFTDVISHYIWLEKNLPLFLRELGREELFNQNPGLIQAHGDKAYGYRDEWEEAGIPFHHGVLIYLLSYLKPWAGQVDRSLISDWVINTYPGFKPSIPRNRWMDIRVDGEDGTMYFNIVAKLFVFIENKKYPEFKLGEPNRWPYNERRTVYNGRMIVNMADDELDAVIGRMEFEFDELELSSDQYYHYLTTVVKDNITVHMEFSR